MILPKAKQIIGQMPNFPITLLMTHSLESDTPAICAGGAVANTIINMCYPSKNAPINDFDVFIKGETGLKRDITVTKVTDNTYMEIVSPRLSIAHREVDPRTNVDHIYVDCEPVHDMAFVEIVLQSFDLNCVQAGIAYDGKKFVLFTTPEFDRFMTTLDLQVVNIHSRVTLARLLKKAQDLKLDLKVNREVEIIKAACNVENLNKLTTEQTIKHWDVIEAYNYYLGMFKAPRLYERVFEIFGESLHASTHNRPLKIKFLRNYIYASPHNQKLMEHILGKHILENIMFSQDSILAWLYGANIEHVNTAYDFVTKFPETLWLFKGKTLRQTADRIDKLMEASTLVPAWFKETVFTSAGSAIYWDRWFSEKNTKGQKEFIRENISDELVFSFYIHIILLNIKKFDADEEIPF